jgi:hypothetical protein
MQFKRIGRARVASLSARARAVSHRRVLQVDYAACELAPPLEWMLN